MMRFDTIFWKCLAMTLTTSTKLFIGPRANSSQQSKTTTNNYKPETAFAPVSATISIHGAPAA